MNRTTLTRRRVLQLSGLAFAGTITAACAQATPAPEAAAIPAVTTQPAAAGAERPVVTIFVGMGTGTAPEQQEVQNGLAAEWNASGTDIKVEHMYVPHDESRTKWAAMMAAGTPPAINMPSGVEQAGRFQDTNLDIGPYLERDQYDLSDFGDLIPEIGKYGGITYGVVMGVYPSFLYYNEDLFDQAEVDYPTHDWAVSDWNYDGMVEMAQKLSLDGSDLSSTQEGFSPEDQSQWGYDELQCGVSINALAQSWGAENMGWSDDFRTLYFNQQAWVDRLQWVSDAIWKWYIMPSAQQSAAAAPGFDSGKLGIDQCHSWMMGEFAELPFRWNVAAIPFGPAGKRVAQCDVDGFLICNQFADLDAAWEVAKWMMEPDQMIRLNLTWGALPPRASLQERYMEEMASKFPNLDMQVLFDSLGSIDVPNHETYLPRYGEVWDAYYAGLDRIVTGDEKSAQVVLDEVQATVQGYLDEHWAQQS